MAADIRKTVLFCFFGNKFADMSLNAAKVDKERSFNERGFFFNPFSKSNGRYRYHYNIAGCEFVIRKNTVNRAGHFCERHRFFVEIYAENHVVSSRFYAFGHRAYDTDNHFFYLTFIML